MRLLGSRLLTVQQKESRVKASETFLRRYIRQGLTFLDRIITTDETWLHYYDLESKQESMVLKTPTSPPPEKARVSKSMRKVMFIFVMDSHDNSPRSAKRNGLVLK